MTDTTGPGRDQPQEPLPPGATRAQQPHQQQPYPQQSHYPLGGPPAGPGQQVRPGGPARPVLPLVLGGLLIALVASIGGFTGGFVLGNVVGPPGGDRVGHHRMGDMGDMDRMDRMDGMDGTRGPKGDRSDRSPTPNNP